jgi:hypothetical protein
MQIECRNYAYEHGIDKPEIDDWVWPYCAGRVCERDAEPARPVVAG